MKISAVIDSYNYERFLPEAIESVLNQSLQPDELIVVDDGSIDGSFEIASEMLKGCSWARVISKENGGQLSALTRGVLEAKGDLIAFLDCDDVWLPNHLKEAHAQFEKEEKLSLYFGAYEEIEGGDIVSHYGYQSGLLGPTLVATACGQSYFGSVCSTLVAKASDLKSCLPLPLDLEKDWRINADNIVVWLTSLSGGLKFNDPTPTIRYRNHQNNNTSKSNNRAARKYRRSATARVFKHWGKKNHIPEDIASGILEEFHAHPNSSRSLRKEYFKAVKKSKDLLGFPSYFFVLMKLL